MDEFRRTMRQMNDAGWAYTSPVVGGHCLLGSLWSQQDHKPLTRRERVQAKLRILRFNLGYVGEILRHPFTYSGD